MVVRTAQLHAEGKLGDHHAALAKAFCTLRMRETVAWAREILGGNGISTDYNVARFFTDAEVIYNYEGTYQMQNLIVGKAITGSLTRDAGAPPTVPVTGSGDHATAVGLFSAIVMGLYRRERTGTGSYVTTSLLAEGVWAAGMVNAAALCDATFFPLHDRKAPPNAALNVYRTSDDTWFMLVVTPDKLPALAEAIGRADLLADARFSDAAKLAANMAQLTAILDEVFPAQPIAHWHDVLARGHITFDVVKEPGEVVKDPQLRENGIVVPIEGAGGALTFTISSPIQVHGVTKEPARRAPALGEHNEQVLEELGFSATEIEGFRASRAIPGVGVGRKP